MHGMTIDARMLHEIQGDYKCLQILATSPKRVASQKNPACRSTKLAFSKVNPSHRICCVAA